MLQDYTHISIVLDRSGSMHSIRDDMIGGLNKLLKDQRETPGKATLSLVRFDHQIELVGSFIDLKLLPDVDRQMFKPRGNTALLDAIGFAIDHTGQALAQIAEQLRPSKVVVLIITDGEENYSKEFSYAQIAEKIKHQSETYKWEFVFLGANQDAIATASKMGIAKANAMTYAANSDGVGQSVTSVSKNLRSWRGGGQSVAFSDEDREIQTSCGVADKANTTGNSANNTTI